jgi:hypothetical protein
MGRRNEPLVGGLLALSTWPVGLALTGRAAAGVDETGKNDLADTRRSGEAM